jgi:hypothetical protein
LNSRADSFVVKTYEHFPTDSNLLWAQKGKLTLLSAARTKKLWSDPKTADVMLNESAKLKKIEFS